MSSVVVFPFITTRQDARVVELQGIRDRIYLIAATRHGLCSSIGAVGGTREIRT